MKPLKVAQIMGKWVGGGVESVVMNYYENIDKTKIQFDFICDSDSTNIPYKKIQELGGRVFLIPPYQKIFSYQKELRKILKKNNYTIVHSHINTLSIFPLYNAKKVGVPIRIAHSHSTTNKKEWKKNLMKQILKPLSKINATNYFCCSELAGRWLFGNKEYDNNNIFLLNNAIDVEKFQYNQSIRKEVRKELKISESTLVFGHIGRFVKQKNHAFLVEIFNEIHSKNKNTVLILAGQGPLTEKIQEKVNDLKLTDCVKFLGQRNDANRLYQAFDVFLLPSLYEGLPVVGIEAQAAGLLCIFSNDISKETKIINTTEFISLEENAPSWAKLITNYFNNFKRVNTNKEVTENGFNIKQEAKQLEQFYLNSIRK